MPSLPAPKSPKPPAPLWQTPAEARAEAARNAVLGGHAAAAGRPRYRPWRTRHVARLRAAFGPAAGFYARPNDGLCRSGAPRPAAGHATKRHRPSRPRRPWLRTGWIVQVGALESESEANNASISPAPRPVRCSVRPIPSLERSSPRTMERLCTPERASPVSIAIPPKRCAKRLKRADISSMTVRN